MASMLGVSNKEATMPESNNARRFSLDAYSDEQPYRPEGWDIRTIKQLHRRRASFENGSVAKFTMPSNGGTEWYSLEEVLEKLEEIKKIGQQFPATANILDFLIDHPWLIPDSYKANKGHKFMCFGSLYQMRDGYVRIRYLEFIDGHWTWGYSQLKPDWGSSFCQAHPVLMFETQK